MKAKKQPGMTRSMTQKSLLGPKHQNLGKSSVKAAIADKAGEKVVKRGQTEDEEEKALEDKCELKSKYGSKLNSESAQAASHKIIQNDMFEQILNDRETIEEIVQRKKHMSVKAIEEIQKYFKREKDPLEASQRHLKQEGVYNISKMRAYMDPGFKAMIGEGCHAPKELSFEDRVDRIFKKIQLGAIRHANNFKNTNYDLDSKVTCFMNAREMRQWKKIARQSEEELEIAVVPQSDGEVSDSGVDNEDEMARKRQEAYEKRIENIFKWHPNQKTRYFSDVVDMCIPNSAVIPQAQYDDIVEDSVKVDQIATILIRYNKLPMETFDQLCFVIPKIDSWDFAALRDGKKELRHLRSKILGIPTGWNVNMADIDCKVAEVERQIALVNPVYAKMIEERNAVSLMPFLQKEDEKTASPLAAEKQDQLAEPISLFKLKTLVPNSGILKNEDQLYQISRSLSRGQLLIKPDRSQNARELFLKHMDDIESQRKPSVKFKRDKYASSSRKKQTPSQVNLLDAKSEKTLLKTGKVTAVTSARKKETKTDESRMGGELQAKLVQQLKERNKQMELKKETLKQLKIKEKERSAFYKRLANSVEDNLVDHQVLKSLSSSFESDHRNVQTTKYVIELAQLPERDRIKLQPKPRPRDFYQPPSQTKLLERKMKRYAKQQLQLQQSQSLEENQWAKQKFESHRVFNRASILTASVDSLSSLAIEEENYNTNQSVENIISFRENMGPQNQQQRSISFEKENNSRTVPMTHAVSTQAKDDDKNPGSHALQRSIQREDTSVHIALNTPHDSDIDQKLEKKLNYGHKPTTAITDDKHENFFPNSQLQNPPMRKPETANPATQARQKHSLKSKCQTILKPGSQKQNSRLFSNTKLHNVQSSDRQRNLCDFTSERKGSLESSKLAEQAEQEKDMMYYKSSMAATSAMSQSRAQTSGQCASTSPQKLHQGAESRSNYAFPKRENLAMRPQSGVPLSSNRVVPKNLERKMYQAAFPTQIASQARSRQPSYLSPGREYANSCSPKRHQSQDMQQQRSQRLTIFQLQSSFVTTDSQDPSTIVSSKQHRGMDSIGVQAIPNQSFSSTHKHKEPSKTSLGTTANGTEVFSIKKSDSLDKSEFTKKHTSLDQVNVSNRFMSMCESLGIPVNRSRANQGSGADQAKHRRKQQLLFSVANPDSYYTGSLWNAQSPTVKRATEQKNQRVMHPATLSSSSMRLGPVSHLEQTRNQNKLLSHEFNIQVQDDHNNNDFVLSSNAGGHRHLTNNVIDHSNVVQTEKEIKMSQTFNQLKFLDLQRSAYIDYDRMLKQNAMQMQAENKTAHDNSQSDIDNFNSDQQVKHPKLNDGGVTTSVTITASGLGTEAKLQEDAVFVVKNSLKRSTQKQKSKRRLKASSNNTAVSIHKRSTVKRKPFLAETAGLKIDAKPTPILNRQNTFEQTLLSTLRTTPDNLTPFNANEVVQIASKSVVRPNSKPPLAIPHRQSKAPNVIPCALVNNEEIVCSSQLTSEKKINFSEHEDCQPTLSLNGDNSLPNARQINQNASQSRLPQQILTEELYLNSGATTNRYEQN